MTKTQLRATCPACFAQQATRRGRMVDHGYKRPQDWHQNVGTCSGAGHMHFGTPEGRDYTASLAQRLRDTAVDKEHRATAVLAGTADVWTTKKVGRGVWMPVVKENPTEADRKAYASALHREAEGMRSAARDFDREVKDWKAMEPVKVEVEPKVAVVHFAANWYRPGPHKACAGSAMAAHRGWPRLTTVAAEVTCARCKQRRIWHEAQEAQQS